MFVQFSTSFQHQQLASDLVMTAEYLRLPRYIGIRDNPLSATNLLTYSTEQSPFWEANRFAASQETPYILWNPKVHYRIHKCPSPVPILCQIDPVHIPTSNFLKFHLNIILPSTSGSPQWTLSFRFPHQDPVYASPHLRYMLRPSNSSRFHHPKNLGEEYRSLSP